MIWVTLNMPSPTEECRESSGTQGISHCLESGDPALLHSVRDVVWLYVTARSGAESTWFFVSSKYSAARQHLQPHQLSPDCCQLSANISRRVVHLGMFVALVSVVKEGMSWFVGLWVGLLRVVDEILYMDQKKFLGCCGFFFFACNGHLVHSGILVRWISHTLLNVVEHCRFWQIWNASSS